MSNFKLILGSSSKWRAQVLEQAGLAFEMLNPQIDEKAIRDPNPESLVMKIANAKADALLPLVHEPSLLITSDGVVVCEGVVREKPRDQQEARSFLLSYIESPIEMINALVVTNTRTGKRYSKIDRGAVYFKPTLAEVVEPLIEQGEIFSCSGAMRVEDPLVQPHIEKMTGEIDCFQGMPISSLKQLLAAAQLTSSIPRGIV